MAVPGRNRTLFRCVFRSRYGIRSAVNFRYGWDSYVLSKLMNTWHIYTACMNPTLREVLRYSASNVVAYRNTQRNIMFNFHPGLPHITSFAGLLKRWKINQKGNLIIFVGKNLLIFGNWRPSCDCHMIMKLTLFIWYIQYVHTNVDTAGTMDDCT